MMSDRFEMAFLFGQKNISTILNLYALNEIQQLAPIEYLKYQGADIFAVDSLDRNALHWAVLSKKSSLRTIKLLVRLRLDIT